MKKYLLYTLLLVALLIGISATTSKAEETGDLTLNFGLPENYGISDTQDIGFTIYLSNNGEPVSGTFPAESINKSIAVDSITFNSDGKCSYSMRMGNDNNTPSIYSDDTLIYYPDKASLVIKNIPVGTTYKIIPDNEPLTPYTNTSCVEYYTEDAETGSISSEGNIVNYTIKPKKTKIVITYLDRSPDYNTPYASFDLTLHAYSLIPDAMHYYNSSNPDEKIEIGKQIYSGGTTDFISTITFEKGESIIIEDAPLGVQFYVTPSSPSLDQSCASYYDNQLKYFQTQSGKIWGENGIEYYYWVELANGPQKLTITKELSGPGADMTKEFTFKLTGYSFQRDFVNFDNPERPFGPLNSTYLYNVIDIESGEIVETRETTFNDGVAYVQCKAGQKIEIGTVRDLKEVAFEGGTSPKIDFANKLYEWTRFDIEEVDCDDYTSEVNPPERIHSLPATVTITNQRKFTGSLTIKKEVTEGVPEDKEFTLKLRLTDGATDLPTEYDYTGSKEGTLVFEDGIATITLKHGESITISGLPLGAIYEVSEDTDEYDVSYDNNVEEIKEDSTVTVTNSVKTEEDDDDETVIIDDDKNIVEDPQENQTETPHTGDNVVIYIVMGLVGIAALIKLCRKK